MRKIGKVIIVTRNKNALVRVKRKLRLGLKIYDEKMRNIGFVYDIIGPVKNPYAVIRIDASKIKLSSLLGKSLYVENKTRKRRR